jgi:hypothetical protein
MTPGQNLLSDMAEVSHDLRNWAEDKLDEGCTAQEIIDLLREADCRARLTLSLGQSRKQKRCQAATA